MAKKFYSPIQLLGRIIFKFESMKGNIVFKLVTKSFNTKTGEILEGDTLISEAQAVSFATNFGIEIKELPKKEAFDELTYEEYLKQEAELDAELEAKRLEKENE